MDELKLKLTLEIDELKQQLEEARGEVTKLQGELSNVGKTSGGSGESVQLSSVREQLRAAQAEASKLTTSFREVVNIQGQGRAASERYVAGLRDVVDGLKQLRGRADEGTTTQVALEGAIRGTTETIVRLERELSQLESQQSLAKQKQDADQFRGAVTTLEAEFKKLVNAQRELIQSNNLNADAQARLKAEYAQVAESAQQLADANEGDAARIKRIESLTTSRLQAEKQLNAEIQRKAAQEANSNNVTDEAVDANTRLQRKLQEIIEASRDLDLARKQTLVQGDLEKSQVELLEKEYADLTVQLAALRKEYVGNAQATKQIQTAQSQVFNATERARTGFTSASRAISGASKSSNTANQALIELGRGFSDAQQFSFGFTQGLIAISNNLTQTTEIGSRLVQQSGGIKSAFSTLTQSLAGAGGLIFAINAVALALPLFSRKIEEEINRAKGFATEIDGVSSALNRLRGSSQSDFFNVGALQAELAQLERLRESFNGVEGQIDRINTLTSVGVITRFINPILGQSIILRSQMQRTEGAVGELRNELGTLANVDLDKLSDRIRELRRQVKESQDSVAFLAPELQEAYRIAGGTVDLFASKVDAAGNPLVSYEDQVDALNRQFEIFRANLAASGNELDQSERTFLSWFEGIINTSKAKVKELPKLIDPSSLEYDLDEVSRLLDQEQREIEDYYKRISNARVDILSSEIDLAKLNNDLDKAARLIEARYLLEDNLIRDTFDSEEELQAARLRNLVKYQNALKGLETPTQREPIEAARRLTAELALFQSNTFQEAKDLIDADTEARKTAAQDRIKDAKVLQAELARIEAEGLQAKQTIEMSKLDVTKQFGDLAVDAIANFTEAGTNIGLVSAKQAFNIQKALGVSQATIDAYRTISSIMADGTLPTAVKIPLSIAQGAAAFARVAAIASTKFGDGATSSGGSSQSASSFSEGFGFSEITPNSQPVSMEADNISERLRNADNQPNNITIENRVSNKEFYTLVKSGEGEILANSQSASRDRF